MVVMLLMYGVEELGISKIFYVWGSPLRSLLSSPY